MIKIDNEIKVQDIISYLKNDIINCIYIFIDISKFGLKNRNIDVYKDYDTILMKYFNSLNTYKINKNNSKEIANFVLRSNIPIITGLANDCMLLKDHLGKGWRISYGRTYEIFSFLKCPNPEIVQEADIYDLEECASLVCSDEEIGGHYKVNELAQQFKERFINNFSRHYIIKKNNKIIAHSATYAELDDISVTSGIIVLPEYRGQNYGKIIESYLINKLLSEDKRVFTFLRTKKRYDFIEKYGVVKFCTNGKLTKLI